MVQYILVTYFIHNSLYLLEFYFSCIFPIQCILIWGSFCILLKSQSIYSSVTYFFSLKCMFLRPIYAAVHTYSSLIFIDKLCSRASLVTQWLRICLPMQGTRVQALVREDPTCHGATKPVHHNCWACALEPASHNYRSPCATTTEAHAPRARAPQREATAMRSPRTATKSSPRSLQLEKARAQQQRPNTAKNKNK